MPEKPSEEGVSLTPKLDRWNKDEEAQAWLAQILSDARMQQALDVVTEMGVPQGLDPVSIPGEELLTKMALSQAQLNGYHTALRNLRILTVPSKPVASIDHGGWKGPALQKEFKVGPDGKLA